MKLEILPERLFEIADLVIQGLLEDDRESALYYLENTVKISPEEREYFGI